MSKNNIVDFRFLAEPTDVNFGGKVHGGTHMLQLFMKEFNSMPDQVKLLNDSQQLEQMMRSWIPGNNIFKKNFKPIIPDIIHPFETYF